MSIWRRLTVARGHALVLTAMAGLAIPVMVSNPARTEAAAIVHASLVPVTPARGYPIILDTPTYVSVNPNCPGGCNTPREVLATDQAGRYIVSGGNFHSVELQNGTVLAQKYFAAWNIDTKQIACAGLVFDNEVLAVEPGPTADTVFVAGRFTKITGLDGVVRTRNKVALIRLTDCKVDTTFISLGANDKISDLVRVGTRLFVGGDFTTIGGQSIAKLAELNATTGAVNTAFQYSFSGALTSAVRGMGASPDGSKLVVGGRFGTVTGNGRSITNPTAVFNISNPAAPQLTAHSSTGYRVPVNYLQDVSVSPDGTLIGLAYGSATIADYVYLTPATESTVAYRWEHYMQDSNFGIAVSNNAVYVGGHFCKIQPGPGATEVMSPNGLAQCTGVVLGGVWRSKLAALALSDGTPLTWNPGQASFVGSHAMTVTTRGLLIGYDGTRTNGIRTGALAFLDFGPGVEDTTPPGNVTFMAPAAGATVNNPATIKGTATDNIAVASFRVAVKASDGRFVQADASLATTRYEFGTPATAGAFSLNVLMPAGTYTAEAKAVDAAGLKSATWVTRSFVQSGIEGVKPTTTIAAPAAPVPTESPLTITGQASDNVQISAIRVRVRNAAGLYVQANGTIAAGIANQTVAVSPALPAPSTTWSVNLADRLPADTYTMDVKLTDPSGNVNTISATFTVTNISTIPTKAISSYDGFLALTGAYTTGYVFTVDKAMSLTALGLIDGNSNGIVDSASPLAVGLWQRSNATLLATASIPVNATPEGRWFYGPLATPFTLQPGTEYVVGGQYGSEASTYNGTVTTDSAVHITNYAYIPASTLTYPSNQGANPTGYGYPNMKLLVSGPPLSPKVTITSPAALLSPGASVSIDGTVTDNVVVDSITIAVTNAAGQYLQDNLTFATAANDLAATYTGIGTPNASFGFVAGALPNDVYQVRVTALDKVRNTTVTTSTFEISTRANAVVGVTSYTGFLSAASQYTMGYTFTVTTPIEVSSLGLFDTNGNGQLDNTQPAGVALWQQSTQAVLGTATVSAAATPENGWFYADLPQRVTLQPGVVYVVGAHYYGEPYPYGGTVTTRSEIQRINYAYVPTTTLAYPSQQGAGANYGVPNMKYAAVGAAAPVPAIAPAPAMAPAPAVGAAAGVATTQQSVVNVAVVAVSLAAIDPQGDAIAYLATGLPNGLTLNPQTGLITGSPTVTGRFQVVATSTDAAGTTHQVVIDWIVT